MTVKVTVTAIKHTASTTTGIVTLSATPVPMGAGEKRFAFGLAKALAGVKFSMVEIRDGKRRMGFSFSREALSQGTSPLKNLAVELQTLYALCIRTINTVVASVEEIQKDIPAHNMWEETVLAEIADNSGLAEQVRRLFIA